ncbi:helix-turn-helix domain-containing protein [Arthrobacter agilis]|uniref:helix-turn-helix domain-containing protein n=1 Tax=Arthrobacter agilis TaxID=37921 RepID=UPI00236665BF|nr:helix-turn-helix domain-containing protein [Arthrobacter agilis]WDF34525.1 helix-turn-helix domain-containing protein [Arthrobacter agilis]
MPKHDPRPDYTVKEIAALTKLCRETVLQLVSENRFPGAYRAGSGSINSPIRIPAAALDHYRTTQPLAIS